MKTHVYRYIPIGLLIFLLTLFHGAWAEVPKIASIRLQVDFSNLNRLWFEALKLLDNGEFHEAHLKLLELDVAKAQKGLKNLPDHSTVLIKKAFTLKDQKQLEEALELLLSAKQLSPDFPAVHFALAKFRFARDMTDVYGIGRDLLRGLMLKTKEVQTIIAYANNGLSILLLSFGITGTVFIVFSFAYYRKAIFYYIKELLPIPFPMFIANIIGWVLLGIITLTLGVSWGVLFLALLLIPHVDSGSKRILQVFLVFGILLAILLLALSVTFTMFDGSYFQALTDVAYGNYSTRTVNVLQQRLEKHENDVYAIFGLAYIAGNVGHVQSAVAAYEEIESYYPERAALQNNLGNLYYLQYRNTGNQQRYEEAKAAYSSAITFSTGMFEPRYNIARLIQEKDLTDENAERQFAFAREKDTERFTQYAEYFKSGVITIDASFSTLTLLKKLGAQESRQIAAALSNALWASGSRLKNPWFFSGASLLLFGLTWVFGRKKKGQKERIRYCQMCGDPYTVRRKKSEKQEKESKFCTQCTYIFKKKAVVKPEKRVKKIEQIQFRQTLRGFIAKGGSVFFPGSGQIYFGYIAKGILIAFLFYSIATVLLLKGYTRILLDAGKHPGFSQPTMIIITLVLIGIYAFNVRDIWKLSPKNQ